MFTYIYKGTTYTNTDTNFMASMGMDAEAIESVHEQLQLARSRAEAGVRAEAEKRIERHWNPIGQINVALGIYSESDSQACIACISAHRVACNELLQRDDLLEINYTDDAHWPGD